MMNIEVLATTLETHMLETDKKIENINGEIKSLERGLTSKMSIKEFRWLFGVMLFVLTSLFSFLIWQQNEIFKEMNSGFSKNSQDITSIKEAVSKIQGKLEPYSVEFKN